MIRYGCSYANGDVLIKCVGENLLPTAQRRALWRPGSTVTAPRAGNRHINLLCNLVPGQAFVAQLQDLLGGGGMSWSAATHGDASTTQTVADRAPVNA
jgi:hypothetical protein